jgi:hypothetical protein
MMEYQNVRVLGSVIVMVVVVWPMELGGEIVAVMLVVPVSVVVLVWHVLPSLLASVIHSALAISVPP